MRENISIGLLGLGVVGSGVIKLIHDHQEELVHQIGSGVRVDHVLFRNIEKASNADINPEFLTTNVEDVLNEPTIDVIVEVMGCIEQTPKLLLQTFEQGKPVITANNDL